MVESPEKGRTITIKINGEHRSYEESHDTAKEINDKQEFENNSRIENKANSINSDKRPIDEIAAAKETVEDDSFDWILPEETAETDLVEYKIATQTKKGSKKGKATFGQISKVNKHRNMLTSVFITVFFAILLGTGFGIIMLKLVISEHTAEIDQQPAVAEPVEEDHKLSEALVSTDLQPISTYVIQGGVFSNIEAAKQIQDDHIQKGISSKVLEMNGQAVLFLGVAASIEEAKKIGNDFKEKGYESFAKPITLEEKTLKELLPEEKTIIDKAPANYHVLTEGLTEAALTSTLSDSLANKMTAQFDGMDQIKDDGLKNESIMSIKSELNKAYQLLLEYKESKDSTVLTKVQQHLLEFISVYHTL